ncbi:MAG TPA: hypothetical protein PL180_17335 [Spirochaetota bacterium]|nr:hypothetical protein [Smithellaceae bacterium]HPL18448.1 hypothetical protein [Spirochaetota bacterium]
MKNITIEVTSVPDREKLVAEIWLNNRLVAEINQESEELALELYVEKDKLSIPLNDFIEALNHAKEKLVSLNKT